MNTRHRFWCFAIAMAILTGATQAQSPRSRSSSSRSTPSRSAPSRPSMQAPSPSLRSSHSSGFSRAAADGIGRIFSPSRSSSRASESPRIAGERRSQAAPRVFESPRYSVPSRSFESPSRRSFATPETSLENRRRYQESKPHATRFTAPSVSNGSPRRRYLASHYSNMESAFGGHATSLAPSKFLNAPSTLSSHASAFNAGAVVTSSASWCKKPSFHASIGLGWPYWFCGSWYGSHIAYYFSLAWWEPYACYPWYASWNPYPCNGWSYWYAPWVYAPVVAPVYYCDYYTAPTVIHTTKVVHEVAHVETSDDGYTKKYSAAPAKEEADPAEELKKLTPSEQFQRLGDIHFREGRYDQAAVAYERAIQENSDHAALRFVLADARFAMGDFHGAASAIRQGLAKDPGLAKAKASKLAFYEKPEAFEKQLEALRVYASEHPADADAQLVLGFNLLFSGKEDEAREAFTKAKAIDSEDAAATLFLAR